MRRIRSASRAARVYTSLGYSEMDGNSLYMAQVLIDPTGAVINHRRKIKPTHVEKLVFGEGSGDSLDSVVETEIGRLGHLNCWENVRSPGEAERGRGGRGKTGGWQGKADARRR